MRSTAHTRDIYVRSPGLVSPLALTTSVLAPDYHENPMEQKGAWIHDNAMIHEND